MANFRPRRMECVWPPANRKGVKEAYSPCDIRLRVCRKLTATRDMSMWRNSSTCAAMSAQTTTNMMGEIKAAERIAASVG